MTSVKNIFGNKLPVQPEQQPAMNNLKKLHRMLGIRARMRLLVERDRPELKDYDQVKTNVRNLCFSARPGNPYT